MTTRSQDGVPSFPDARPRPEARRGPGALLLGLVIAFLTPHLLPAAPWVVITEIHYHPPEGDALEFIEILNREPPRLDLTGWSLDGEVEFSFPQDRTLLPGERLVIARDPRALTERYPGLRGVVGPYAGKLDNDGGRITLRNPAGARVCEVRYDRRGDWPAPPDGAGHTLSIRSPYFDPEAPASWRSSRLIGGTPGAPNSSLLIRRGDEWKYRRGRQAPPSDWNAPEHDDSAWESGRSGFGYDDGDDATEFPDMEDSYASLFVRKRFDVPDPARLGELVLVVDYDDGFVAYLGGREVARSNIGRPGEPVPFDAFADGNHEAGTPERFPLGLAADLVRDGALRTGANVLSVQVHNNQLSSSDLTLIVELEARERPTAQPPRINEILSAPGDASSQAVEFVEIYNPSPDTIDLGGHYLSDDPANLKKVELPRTLVGPRGFATFTALDLGARLTPTDGDLFVTLTRPDGLEVLDAIRLTLAPATEGPTEGPASGEARPPLARGRYPDGSSDIAVLRRPSPGEANAVSATRDIVFNEIMYNTVTETPDDEFIELYNRGQGTIALGGYRLEGGVRFQFGDDARLAPDAYLVIARNPGALGAKYGLEAPLVVGPYEGQLSNRSETLVLRDRDGNVVDRVEFADRAPWPHWADGLGSSLELVHPSLDNSLGASWAASDDRDKAEWQTLSYTGKHAYVMRGLEQEMQMLLLSDGECFVDGISLGPPGKLLPIGDYSRRGRWQGRGTHERSRMIARGPAVDTEYYHLIADGRGNPRHNYAALPLDRRRLNTGSTYTVKLGAKWQRGSPLLLTRMAGQSLARLHRLKVPSRLGSPGARNTVYQERPAPAVGVPEQYPVAPTAREEVTLTVPITSVEEVVSAEVHFRHESDGLWRRAGLTPGPAPREPSGARDWTGAIPPLPEGRVEFYVEARSEGGGAGTYPPDAVSDRGTPVRTALYGVGLVPHPDLPSYTLLVSDREWRALRSRDTLSNRLARGTLVFGDERIFYDVGVRPRGSPFTRRGDRNWRIVLGADTLDGRRSLTIDAQVNRGLALAERLTFWLIDALHAANSRQQFVYFRVHGTPGSIVQNGGERGVYEDVEKIDGSFLDRWFDPRARGAELSAESPKGRLHKVDDYWELTLQGDRSYQEAFFRYRSDDPEDYRWNFPPRIGEVSEDFEPLIELIRFLDMQAPDEVFAEKAREVIAVDQWIRVLAARTLSGDWDTMGGTRGKNAFVYLSPADGLWYLLPWDADLAWGREYHSLSTRFESIRRLLKPPLHNRLFHGYLEYLVRRKLDRGYLAQVLDELESRSGHDTSRYARFASEHREIILRAARNASKTEKLEVTGARRIEREDGPDLASVRGEAPVLVRRFLLDGIEGAVTMEGADGWTAEFPVGPEGGELKLEALDFGGYLVDTASVRIEERPGAPPLIERDRLAVAATRDVAIAPAVDSAEASVERTSAADAAVETASVRRQQARRFASTERRSSPPAEPTLTTTRSLPERRTFRTRPSARPRPARQMPRPSRPAPIERLGPILIVGVAAALIILHLLATAFRRHRRGVARRRARTPVATSWRFDDLQPESGPARPEPRPPAPPPVLTADQASPGGAAPVAGAVRHGQGTPPAAGPAAWPTGRHRLASPVASALRDLAGRDFERADRALRFLWASGRNDIAALIAALVDRRSTPIVELDMTDDDGVRVVAACGEPGVEVRDIAELLLGNAIGVPPVDHPGQEDWVAHWQARMRGA